MVPLFLLFVTENGTTFPIASSVCPPASVEGSLHQPSERALVYLNRSSWRSGQSLRMVMKMTYLDEAQTIFDNSQARRQDTEAKHNGEKKVRRGVEQPTAVVAGRRNGWLNFCTIRPCSAQSSAPSYRLPNRCTGCSPSQMQPVSPFVSRAAVSRSAACAAPFPSPTSRAKDCEDACPRPPKRCCTIRLALHNGNRDGDDEV